MFGKLNGIIWIGGSQLVLLISNLMLLKLLTSKISISDFGYYSLCMSVVLFVRQVIYDSFSMVVAKNCSSNFTDESKLSTGFSVVKYSTDRVGMVIILFGFLFYAYVDLFFDDSKLASAILICSMYLLANGAQGIYLNVLNSIGKRKFAALFAILDSILKLALAFLFLNMLQGSLNIVLQSISLSALLVFGIIRNFIERIMSLDKAPALKIREAVQENFLICLPLLFPTLLNASRSIGDRWLLAAFMGIDELAIYSVLLQIGYLPMILIFGVAQTYLGPKIYRICKLQNSIDYAILKKLLFSILLTTIIASIISSVVALATANFIFDMFIGSNYKIFSGYLPIFVIAGSLTASAGLLQLVVFGLFDTRISSKLISLSIGFSLVLTFVLIYIFQFRGAIAGLVMSGLIPLFIFSIAVYRKLF